MQVAVAGVEHVAGARARARPPARTRSATRLGQARARHHAVHDVEAARGAAVGAERRLAPAPERRALGRRPRRRASERAPCSRAIAVMRSTCAGRLTAGPSTSMSSTAAASSGSPRWSHASTSSHGLAVHDLHRRRHDAGGDHRRDRAAGVLDRGEVEAAWSSPPRAAAAAARRSRHDRRACPRCRPPPRRDRRRARRGASPPSVTTVPSCSTTTRPSTWLSVTPYLRQCGPPALVATLPPIVLTCCEDGIGRVVEPVRRDQLRRATGSRARAGPRRTCARDRREHLVHAVVTSSTPPPCCGVAPPASPVPAPRGVTGTPCACAQRTSAATSSVERGSTTTSGSAALERERVGLVGEARGLAVEHAVLAQQGAQLGEGVGGPVHARQGSTARREAAGGRESRADPRRRAREGPTGRCRARLRASRATASSTCR